MKKWKENDKPTCLFETHHKGNIGGGDLYCHQVAEAFDGITKMRYYDNGPARSFGRNHSFTHRFIHTNIRIDSDIYIGCSHFQIPDPVGKERNVLIVFFPNKLHRQQVQGYDTIITCSKFSAQWVKKYWGKDAVCIYPHVSTEVFNEAEFDQYQRAPYMRYIVSVGRFFREPSGHCKHQDILLSAFSELLKHNKSYVLNLVGACTGPSDEIYLSHLQDIVKDLKIEDSVRFHKNVNLNDLAIVYRNSFIYWHANGYKVSDPFETEHFGIVFAEAIASGCYILPYANGGYREFYQDSWYNIPDLVKKTLKASELTLEDVQDYRMTSYSVLENNFSKAEMQDNVTKLIKR